MSWRLACRVGDADSDHVKTFDQWLLFAFASGFTVSAVRDYVGGHWGWAVGETVLAVLMWWWLGRFRRSLYGSAWPTVR
jgi:O-antigen/teichoic acid export membrane protein